MGGKGVKHFEDSEAEYTSCLPSIQVSSELAKGRVSRSYSTMEWLLSAQIAVKPLS